MHTMQVEETMITRNISFKITGVVPDDRRSHDYRMVKQRLAEICDEHKLTLEEVVDDTKTN